LKKKKQEISFKIGPKKRMRPLLAAAVTLVALANNGRALLGKTDFFEVKTASFWPVRGGANQAFGRVGGGGQSPCPPLRTPMSLSTEFKTSFGPRKQKYPKD